MQNEIPRPESFTKAVPDNQAVAVGASSKRLIVAMESALKEIRLLESSSRWKEDLTNLLTAEREKTNRLRAGNKDRTERILDLEAKLRIGTENYNLLHKEKNSVLARLEVVERALEEKSKTIELMKQTMQVDPAKPVDILSLVRQHTNLITELQNKIRSV
jgi:hypothetical protein